MTSDFSVQWEEGGEERGEAGLVALPKKKKRSGGGRDLLLLLGGLRKGLATLVGIPEQRKCCHE